MKSHIRKFFWITALAVILNLLSCDARGTTLYQAAEEYCRLYAAESWAKLGDDPTLQDVFAYIISESSKQKSTLLADALDKVKTDNFNNFYTDVKRNISDALGEEWECDDFDAFFFPKQKVVYLSVDHLTEEHIDPKSNENIVIMVLEGQKILINNSPLTNSSIETIKQAIILTMNGKPAEDMRAFLYFDENSDGNQLPDLLSLLHSKGFSKIGLINF